MKEETVENIQNLPPQDKAGADLDPWGETSVVGSAMPRVDGFERVSGAAVFPSDIVLPNMLYAAILGSPHANARVQSIDVSAARVMPGVRAVLTGKNRRANLTWPYSKKVTAKLFDPNLRFEGEVVAAVAADTPDAAHDALKAIKVAYEELPFVSDERDALNPDAPKVHPDGNRVSPVKIYERGDTAAGFEQADAALERTYRSECELHTPIEPHGCVARWEGDRLTLWESTQGVYSVQETVADVLEMPRSKVRVIGDYVGGGFGSKLEPGKYTIIAALLAEQTGRPVKLFLTREQTMLTMGNRPPANMTLKAGVTKDGTLTAMTFSALATGGAYPAGGTSLLDWLAKDLYLCPNVRTELADVYVNAGPARPFRAPGYPQCSWAVDQMMDELARAVGMDPVEMRLKNIPLSSQAREGEPAYTTTGLAECLRRGAADFGWKEAKKAVAEQPADAVIRRGVGVAACNWFVGNGWPPSTVIVKMFDDGSVNLNMGASDIGTGVKTAMAMIVAEELGVDPHAVQIEHADTGTTQYASASGGSKTLPTEGPAVREAAVAVKKKLLQSAAGELGVEMNDLALLGGRIASTQDDSVGMAVTDAPTLKQERVVMGVGHKPGGPDGKAVIPFAAQFCEVEVNTLTGELTILRFTGAHESGRVINKLTFDNQAVGGVTMGIGFATTEARVLDKNRTGKLCNKNWHDYKLPTMKDAPLAFSSIAIEMPDPEANWIGAKGLGEPVTVPTGAAIANAVFDAVGVRMNETFVNPVSLCPAVAAQKKHTV